MKALLKVVLPVLIASPALAEVESKTLEGPASMTCTGPSGEVEVYAEPGFISYRISANGMEMSKEVHIDDYDQLAPRTTKITPNSGEPFFYLAGTAYVNHLFPAHTRCLPTRAPGKCIEVHEPARWGVLFKEDISLTAHVLEDGSLSFTRLHHTSKESGQRIDFEDLGEGASCTFTSSIDE